MLWKPRIDMGMKLSNGWHLAYCTNIHRGETWAQTFDTLDRYTLAVKARVCPTGPYAIGLRLGEQTARELAESSNLLIFQRWLEKNACYVFTINGFPYGRFHGGRVKEQVYAPDWSTRERLEYTRRLFGLLAELLPPGIPGSVSTVPVSFKEFIRTPGQVRAAQDNLWECVEALDRLCRKTGRQLHLGLEPEPLCYLETTAETVRFFDELRTLHPGDDRLNEYLGVNYDCCHLAIEYEDPREALQRLVDNKIRLSKVHLSNALQVTPLAVTRAALKTFQDTVYFHQVVEKNEAGELRRYRDLDEALQARTNSSEAEMSRCQWRIHFHIPLHSEPSERFGNTADHLRTVLSFLAAQPRLCSHFEMETYTWEVMPEVMKRRNVVNQLVEEYRWTLKEMQGLKINF